MDAQLRVLPGAEGVESVRAGEVRTVAYGFAADASVGLVFTFRRNALVACMRWVLRRDTEAATPGADWRTLGSGEWAVDAENARVRRTTRGAFICDRMTPIRP